MPLPVAAVNDLTTRWAATIDGRSTTLSGLGVWPLLALLRFGADEIAGAELDRALRADPAAAAGLLDTLRAAEAVHAALGLWSAPGLALERTWLDTVPPGAHAPLTGAEQADRRALDDWAREHTNGLIERMPVGDLSTVRLLLASAIAVRTRWEQPFEDTPWAIGQGPWSGSAVAGLRRTSRDLGHVTLAESPAGPLTMLRCQGRDDVDVHLALGAEDAPAGAVLAAAVSALGPDQGRGVPGSELPNGAPGPGLRIGDRASIDWPTLVVRTPRFRVRGEHDLAGHAEIFGLASAMDADRSHFPGISAESLYVSAARQDALAIFSGEGFEAAAVTTFAMSVTAVRRPDARTHRQVELSVDRPFGFLATHRPTGLVLVAGWVAEPQRDPDG